MRFPILIGNVVIENFKSITKLELELGRINVLIGANGCGKSNILEALALCGAAAADRLDNEFLAPRGIRVPDDQLLLKPAFYGIDPDSRIEITVNALTVADVEFIPFKCSLRLTKNSSPYLLLSNDAPRRFEAELLEADDEGSPRPSGVKGVGTYIGRQFDDMISLKGNDDQELIIRQHLYSQRLIERFLVYSPEYRILRKFEEEGQITPLGTYGEGLFKLLTIMSSSYDLQHFTEIKNQLRLIDWFDDFDFAPTVAFGDRSLRIKDKYFDPTLPEMSQRSSNEGFLFLLFYFCLFISDLTPKFFAVDNVDASLNPKLCARLMVQLTQLAKKHDKQAIFTTHNPAVLDGIDLDDDEQRVFVVYRNRNGHTTVKRVQKLEPIPGVEPVRLSEAFMRGYIGGLPNNF